MRAVRTFIFFISLLLSFAVYAQDTTKENLPQETLKKSDSTKTKVLQYGLRIGADLAKPLRTVLDEDYQGFEIVGDFRLSERYYLAAELGNEKRTIVLPNLNTTTSGSYIKAGFNYNAYANWYGMNNLIYGGLRAGFATFNQELNSYTIYTTDDFFEDDTITQGQEFTGLNATWLELQIGIQAEIFHNIFIGLHVQLKRRITETEPDDFDNLYIPGFGRTTDGSNFGAGYGYAITYYLPVFKKRTKVKTDKED